MPYPRAAQPDPNVGLTLTLQQGEVRAGGTVRGELAAQNCSDAAVDITHPSGCQFEHGLYRDTVLAGGRDDQICTQALVADRLGPRETRTWAVVFDTRGRPAADGTRPLLPAGEYEAVAGVSVLAGVWYAPPAILTIRE